MSSLVKPMVGHGRMLPEWFDTKNPQAQAGTTRLRAIDGNLIAGFNKQRQVFEVWGPSTVQGGWVPLVECSDDYGRPFRGYVPWDLICIAIARARQDAETSVDRVLAHNARLEASRERSLKNRQLEGTRYVAKAAAQEWDGTSQHSAEDVMLGFRLADSGRTVRTEEERTELISLPGRTPVGKGRAVAG